LFHDGLKVFALLLPIIVFALQLGKHFKGFKACSVLLLPLNFKPCPESLAHLFKLGHLNWVIPVSGPKLSVKQGSHEIVRRSCRELIVLDLTILLVDVRYPRAHDILDWLITDQVSSFDVLDLISKQGSHIFHYFSVASLILHDQWVALPIEERPLDLKILFVLKLTVTQFLLLLLLWEESFLHQWHVLLNRFYGVQPQMRHLHIA